MRDIELEILTPAHESNPFEQRGKRYRLSIQALGENFSYEAESHRRINEDQLIELLSQNIGHQIMKTIVDSLKIHKGRHGTYDTTILRSIENLRHTTAPPPERTFMGMQMQAAELSTSLEETYGRIREGIGRIRVREGNNTMSGLGNAGFGGLPIAEFGLATRSNKIDKGTPYRKSMILLLRKIGMRKFIQLKRKGYFEEQGKHGTYRFHMDTQGGVSLIQKHSFGKKEREVEWSLCVQSAVPNMPKGDVILSRWLEWKVDEDKFLETANFRNITTRDEAVANPLPLL